MNRTGRDGPRRSWQCATCGPEGRHTARSADRGAHPNVVLHPRRPRGLARDDDVVDPPWDGCRLHGHPDPEVDLGARIDIPRDVAAVADARGDILVAVAEDLDALDGCLRARLVEPDPEVVHAVAVVADAHPVGDGLAPTPDLGDLLSRAGAAAVDPLAVIVPGLVRAVRDECVHPGLERLGGRHDRHDDLVEAGARDVDDRVLDAGCARRRLEPHPEGAGLVRAERLAIALVVGGEDREGARSGPRDGVDGDRGPAAVGDAEGRGPRAEEHHVAEVMRVGGHRHVRGMRRCLARQRHIDRRVGGVGRQDLERPGLEAWCVRAELDADRAALTLTEGVTAGGGHDGERPADLRRSGR